MNHGSANESDYLRKLFLTLGAVVVVGAGVAFLLRLSHVLLLAFAAILLSLLLGSLARFLSRLLHLPERATLLIVVVAGLALLGGLAWMVGPQISAQIVQLMQRLPSAADRIARYLLERDWGRALLESMPAPDDWLSIGSTMLSRIPGFFSTTLGVLASFFIVAVLALYIAWRPQMYVRPVVSLWKPELRPRVEDILGAIAHALRWWLAGRLAAMAVVGVLTTVGLLIIGTPLALALGFIAGILSFVPFLGPLLAIIPMIVVALAESPQQALYVLILYGVVQLVESNFITPLIELRAVSLPPAIVLIAQLAFGSIFGLIGMFLATPLVVVVTVIIQLAYLRWMLEEPVRVLGEDKRDVGGG